MLMDLEEKGWIIKVRVSRTILMGQLLKINNIVKIKVTMASPNLKMI